MPRRLHQSLRLLRLYQPSLRNRPSQLAQMRLRRCLLALQRPHLPPMLPRFRKALLPRPASSQPPQPRLALPPPGARRRSQQAGRALGIRHPRRQQTHLSRRATSHRNGALACGPRWLWCFSWWLAQVFSIFKARARPATRIMGWASFQLPQKHHRLHPRLRRPPARAAHLRRPPARAARPRQLPARAARLQRLPRQPTRQRLRPRRTQLSITTH